MPKNVPPEFTGRFSIKRKRSPKKKDEANPSASPAKPAQTASGSPSPLRGRAESSASSAQISHGDGDSRRPSINKLLDKQADFRHYSPTTRSDSGSSSRKLAVARHRQPSVWDEQSQAEGELMETYSMLEASATRTPSKSNSPLGVPTLSGGDTTYEHEIFLVFAAAYRRLASMPRQDNIAQLASSLVNGLKRATDANHDVYVLGIVNAIRRFATEKPKSIDFLLSAYLEAVERFPEDVITEYGRGKHAGLNRLRGWLQDESLGFRCTLGAEDLAQRDMSDRSNLKFRRGQVSVNLDGVLGEVQEWQRQRAASIIMSVIHARAFALGMLRGNDARTIEELINAGLARRQARWSKADFIGSCVMLRGCLHALTDRWGLQEGQEKRLALQTLLEGFLLQDGETWDDDFVCKAHAAMSLSALTSSKRTDETSEQIYRTHSWIF